MRRGLIAAVMFCAAAAPAAGEEMVSAKTLTCPALAALLNTQGAAVVSSAPGRYERYVLTSESCARSEYASPASVSVGDGSRCPASVCVAGVRKGASGP